MKSENAMPNHLTIEEATAADSIEIKALMDRDWGGEPLVVRGEKYFPSAMPGLISRRDGRLEGFLFYNIDNRGLEIIVFEIFEKFRGLGTRFLDRVKEIARSRGITRIFLMTTNDNLDALRFYQKRGFHLCALHVNSVEVSRKMKPTIGHVGDYGIPVRDELDLELIL